MTCVRFLAMIAALTLASAPAPVDARSAHDLTTLAQRVEVQARLDRLNADLLAHRSATAVLQAWCDADGPAARIVARPVAGLAKPADAGVREILKAGAGEAVNYRRVELVCGDQVLSQADNWYLPGRLTADMNRQLEQTQTPFGVAVAALDFRRRNLSAVLLFRPAQAPGPVSVPAEVLRQSAVLETPDGRPLSLVVETYRREVLRLPLRPVR